MKKKKKVSNLKLFVLLVFVFLLALATFLYVRYQNAMAVEEKEVVEQLEGNEITWIEYKNEEYGFSFDRPKFLKEWEIDNQKGYLKFITFGQTEFTQAKGIGVGITKNNLANEVERIKSEAETNFDVKLAREVDIKVGGKDAVLLDYEPSVEAEDLESRSFVVVESGGYAISVSTHPMQIEKIINSFKFI